MPGLSRHAGITLLESLVAIAILAVAVLGMLGAQLRTLADTQTSVRRAQAVRLIEDFAERIKTHPEGFRLPEGHAAKWDAMPAAPDCRSAACDPQALAHWDLAAWKQAIADTLPLGVGQVFETGGGATTGHPRQFGVMVGWRANERAQGDVDDAAHAAYRKPFEVDGTPGAAACPAGLICHLAHVQP